MANKIKWMIVILFSIGVMTFALREIWQKDATPSIQKPLAVEITKVAEAVVHDTVTVYGNTKAFESVQLTSSVTETVTALLFQGGARVQKGDIIARLSQREELAELAAEKARLAAHQRELKRIKTLMKKKLAAVRDYDEQATKIQVSKQLIELIQAKIQDRTIRAPFDGTVGLRQISPGALIEPGDVITTIDDLHIIKCDFLVPSRFLDQLTVNMRLQVKVDALSSGVFTGKVFAIDSQVSRTTRSILVRALLPNPDGRLKPGMLARINLVHNRRKSLFIPDIAVLHVGQDTFAWLVDRKKLMATKQRIVTGSRKGDLVEIREGLTLHDWIISKGIHRVRPNKMLQIITSAQAKTSNE